MFLSGLQLERFFSLEDEPVKTVNMKVENKVQVYSGGFHAATISVCSGSVLHRFLGGCSNPGFET